MLVQIILYGLLAILVAGGLFLLASRFLPAGEQIAPPLRDEPAWELPPDRTLRPEDVDSVRLPVALRGYRFAETDVLLDRLVHELRNRDAEIARLRGDAPVTRDDVPPHPSPPLHPPYAPPPPHLPHAPHPSRPSPARDTAGDLVPPAGPSSGGWAPPETDRDSESPSPAGVEENPPRGAAPDAGP